MVCGKLLRIIHSWISFVFYLLGFCTEEISLVILIPDFRRNISEQFLAIFCKKSNVIDVEQQQNNNTAITSIKVNNFVDGN